MSRDRFSTPMSRFVSAVPMLVLAVLWLFHGLVLRSWLKANVLPNGFQNEIFHLENALELWIAWQERSARILHNVLFEQYWPPLHYIVACPLLAIERSRDMFVMSNLVFLALLLVSVYAMGARLVGRGGGLLAAALVSFFPSIYGNLRHFEPNVPLTALVAFSLWLLSLSHRFTRRGYSLLFGLAAGLTMMVDRLSGAFFLVFPVLYTILEGLFGARRAAEPRRRQVLANILLAGFVCAAISGYYYYNFFRFHWAEVSPQVGAGEILDTGEHSEVRDPLALTSLLFYPMTLLDGQVGFGPGLLLFFSLILTLALRDRRHRIWWVWLAGPLVVFTLIQKKQIYYTIPFLPAFALLAAAGMMQLKQRWLKTIVVAGTLLVALHQHQALTFGKGLVPERTRLSFAGHSLLVDFGPISGRSPVPYAWVAPRYAQGQPPSGEDLKVEEILEAINRARGPLEVFRVVVFSEDSNFFEGYLTFFIRCRYPKAIVNGLLQNPEGFYENLRLASVFVYVTPSQRRLPTLESIRDTLATRDALEDFEHLPIVSVLEEQYARLTLNASFYLTSGAYAYVYGPRPWSQPGQNP